MYRTYPYYVNPSPYRPETMHNANRMYPGLYYANIPMNNSIYYQQSPNQYIPHSNRTKAVNPIELRDFGAEPFVVNIEQATKQNNNFRIALWTGRHLQLTLMSIKVGEDIGLEIHSNLDQFIRIEEGQGLVKMGDSKDQLDFERKVYDDYAFVIPAGKWHNLINIGNKPLKLYSIYAPPQHPHGTVHETKADAIAAEQDYS